MPTELSHTTSALHQYGPANIPAAMRDRADAKVPLFFSLSGTGAFGRATVCCRSKGSFRYMRD